MATVTAPTVTVEQLMSQLSDRQRRLFVCACARSVWLLLTNPRSRAVVEMAERFADGLATEEEMRYCHNTVPWDYAAGSTMAGFDIAARNRRGELGIHNRAQRRRNRNRVHDACGRRGFIAQQAAQHIEAG